MIESDTWKGIKNLENIKGVVEEFKKKYQQNIEDVRRQKKKERTFRREELPGQFTTKKLFRQLDKQYNEEYWGRLERNWRQWKEEQTRKRRTLEIIWEKEEEIEQKESEIRECTKEDKEKMGNIVNLNYEL